MRILVDLLLTISQEINFFLHFIHICSWYDKSTKTTTAEKETDALTSVRQFYAFIINGVSMYKCHLINTKVSNLVCMTHFWKNIHEVCSK